MKLSILILLASILVMSTSIEIQASQFLYDTFIASPKQCLKQYCSSEIIAIQNNPQYQACKPLCQQNATCWDSCGQQIPNQTLLDLGDCIAQYGCLNNAVNSFYQIQGYLLLCQLVCWYEKYYTQSAQELQQCSAGCGIEELCWETCPKQEVIQNAVQYAQCFIHSGCLPSSWSNYYQPLYNPNCVNTYCSSACEPLWNNPELPEMNMCFNRCLGNKSCWTSCVPENQQQNVNQCIQCAQQNNCKQIFNV